MSTLSGHYDGLCFTLIEHINILPQFSFIQRCLFNAYSDYM